VSIVGQKSLNTLLRGGISVRLNLPIGGVLDGVPDLLEQSDPVFPRLLDDIVLKRQGGEAEVDFEVFVFCIFFGMESFNRNYLTTDTNAETLILPPSLSVNTPFIRYVPSAAPPVFQVPIRFAP
jgi:hypothetical protein